MIAIAIPGFQLRCFFIFVKSSGIIFSSQNFLKIPMARELLAFSLMSFFYGIVNYVEIDIRVMIQNKIHVDDAGI